MSSSSDNNTLLSIHASITGLRVCSFIKLLSVKVLYIYIYIYIYFREKFEISYKYSVIQR